MSLLSALGGQPIFFAALNPLRLPNVENRVADTKLDDDEDGLPQPPLGFGSGGVNRIVF